VKKYLNERGFRDNPERARPSGENSRSTPNPSALAWLLAQPSVTAPIASATNLDQLHELLGAADLKLDPESLRNYTRPAHMPQARAVPTERMVGNRKLSRNGRGGSWLVTRSNPVTRYEMVADYVPLDEHARSCLSVGSRPSSNNSLVVSGPSGSGRRA